MCFRPAATSPAHRTSSNCSAIPPRPKSFFFQAEDGIRVGHVTGVQTCALPIAATVNTEEFELRMRTVVRDNARLDIAAGRFALAQKQLDRVLAITPKDPVAQLYYGDLYRLQAQRAQSPIDKAELAHKALERYRYSAELDPKFPEPYRQLGLLYYQQRLPDRAREAFREYLALKPDAPDAKRIREYMVELDR